MAFAMEERNKMPLSASADAAYLKLNDNYSESVYKFHIRERMQKSTRLNE